MKKGWKKYGGKESEEGKEEENTIYKTEEL